MFLAYVSAQIRGQILNFYLIRFLSLSLLLTACSHGSWIMAPPTTCCCCCWWWLVGAQLSCMMSVRPPAPIYCDKLVNGQPTKYLRCHRVQVWGQHNCRCWRRGRRVSRRFPCSEVASCVVSWRTRRTPGDRHRCVSLSSRPAPPESHSRSLSQQPACTR